MNANPADYSTPYIDIVERTGSGVYDLSLKTRLGDLSGLSSAYLYGDDEPGFGIYTETGFFSGAITAQTGSFAGIMHVATVQGGLETGEKISIGRQVSGTNDGIYINNNNYWYTTGAWRVGGASNFLSLDSANAGNIVIKSETFDLTTSNLIISSSLNHGMLSLGTTPNTSVSGSGKGFYVDGLGNFLLYGSATNYFKFDASAASIDIKADTFDLDATTIIIDSAGSGKIRLGASPPSSITSGTGIYLDGAGDFMVGAASGDHLSWDASESVLTIKGVIRQSSAGTTLTDYADRGTWAHSTAYAVNDLVQYSGSTYKCTSAHTSTDNTNATTGRPDTATNSWAVYAAGGGTGATGADAKTVVVNAESLVFVKAQDGTLTPTGSTMTANNQNTTADGAWATSAGTLSSTVNTHTAASTHVLSSAFVDGMIITYTLASGDGSVVDSVTLKQLDEGSGTVQAILSNSAHVFPAATNGAVSSYAGSGTTIKVYEGATAMTFTTGTPAASQFAVSLANTDDIVEGSISGNGTATCTVADHSAAANGTDEYIMTYTITGKTANGTTFTSFTQIQSLSKSKAGSTGATGAGTNTVNLISGQYVIEYTAAGTHSAANITLTANSQNFDDAYFKFTGGGGAFTDETSYTNGTGQNQDTATFAIPTSYSSTPYTFTVSVQEGSSGGEVASDSITIASVKPGTDGDDAYTLILTNEAHAVPVNEGGTATYTGTGTDFIAYKGTTRLTGITSGTPTVAQFIISAFADTNWSTPDVTSAVVDTYNLRIGDHDGMTAATADCTYTVNLSNEVTLTKKQTFNKTVDGDTGVTGAGSNFVFARASSKPNVPTANGLNIPSADIQWYDAAPAGTDLLWSSKGTVAAGGSAYSWGAVFQVEGTAVAETTIYRLNSNAGNSGGSYNFTNSTLTPPTNWSDTVPALASNGDIVYASSGLFSGAPTATGATTTWSTPVIYSRRTDGTSVTGPTGAGTVFRGDWIASKTYSNTSTRRDIVDYSAVNSSNPYWLCLHDGATGAGENPPTSGTTSNTYWETFGATFSSVATDILFAQDVYASRTINVGTNNSGNAIISLFSDYNGSTDSGNPYIGITATTHGASGIWLGYTGGSAGTAGTPKFYVGDGSNKYLSWNGSNLSFKGTSSELTTGGAFTATAGAIGGWTMADGYLYGLNSGTPTSSPSDGMVLKAGANAVLTTYENTQKRVALGYLEGTPGGDAKYGLRGYDDNGSTVTFEMSDSGQTIAGWDFTNSTLSTTDISLDSTNKKIILGGDTNENQITIDADDAFSLPSLTMYTAGLVTGGSQAELIKMSPTASLKGIVSSNEILESYTEGVDKVTHTYPSGGADVGDSDTVFDSYTGCDFDLIFVDEIDEIPFGGFAGQGTLSGKTVELGSTGWHPGSGSADFDIGYDGVTTEVTIKDLVIGLYNAVDTTECVRFNRVDVYVSAAGYSTSIVDTVTNVYKSGTEYNLGPITFSTSARKFKLYMYFYQCTMSTEGTAGSSEDWQVRIGQHSDGSDAKPTIKFDSYMGKSYITRKGMQTFAGPNNQILLGGTNKVTGDFTVTNKMAVVDQLLVGRSLSATAELNTLQPSAGGPDLYVRQSNPSDGIWCTGNVTAYASDIRLKENILPIESAVNKALQIRGIEFDWKDEVEDLGFYPRHKHEPGLIAQEVEKVVPEAVIPAPFNQRYKTIDYNKLIPLLFGSIHELNSRIEDLETKIVELKNVKDI